MYFRINNNLTPFATHVNFRRLYMDWIHPNTYNLQQKRRQRQQIREPCELFTPNGVHGWTANKSRIEEWDADNTLLTDGCSTSRVRFSCRASSLIETILYLAFDRSHTFNRSSSSPIHSHTKACSAVIRLFGSTSSIFDTINLAKGRASQSCS